MARAQAREELRDRGLPISPLFELQMLTGEKAEPDQVIKETERDTRGKFVGRKAGRIATTLAPKEVWSANSNKT